MKRVYERFRALGMPEGVSLEAFRRVMGGRGAADASEGVGAGAGASSAAANLKGKGKDERMRMQLNSRSRGRDQQPLQQEGEGDWNTALTFLSTHLVGRQEARKARTLISRCVAFSFPIIHLHMSY